MLTFKPIPLWKQLLRTNFVQWKKLAEFLELSEDQCSLIDTKPHFSLNLPMRLASKIPKGTIDDPLFKQFMPTLLEKESFPQFFNDPTCDISHQKTPKLLQKYEGRALLVCTSACAMHCRYCFRQNYPYETSQGHAFELELDEISRDTSIREIILSGGDPLSLSDDVLHALLSRLSTIPQIRRVRFHTRFPIGIPERIDEAFLKILGESQKQLWCVVHANHPNEIESLFPDIEIGAEPPFGDLFGLEVYIDRAVSENDDIVFNAGTHTETIKMRYSDFAHLARAKTENFSQHI